MVPASVGRSSGRALEWQHISHARPVLLGTGLQPCRWLGTWTWTLLCRPISNLHALNRFLSLSLFLSHTVSSSLPFLPSFSLPLFMPECVVVGTLQVHKSYLQFWNQNGFENWVCRKIETHSFGRETWCELPGSYSVVVFIYPTKCDYPGIMATEILMYLITACAL